MKEQRQEFDKAFNLEYDLHVLQSLIEEEYQEFLDAENKIDQWDAIVDQSYIIQQGINKFGRYPKEMLFSTPDFWYKKLMKLNKGSGFYKTQYVFTGYMDALQAQYQQLGFKDFHGGFAEVHKSNMSKLCSTEQEAITTIVMREIQIGECYREKVGDYWVVKCKKQDKVRKSVNFFEPKALLFI